MSPEDYRDGTDIRPRSASTTDHDCERVRRFTEEHCREDLAHIYPNRGPRLGQRPSLGASVQRLNAATFASTESGVRR
jgi:hypothetical protein